MFVCWCGSFVHPCHSLVYTCLCVGTGQGEGLHSAAVAECPFVRVHVHLCTRTRVRIVQATDCAYLIHRMVWPSVAHAQFAVLRKCSALAVRWSAPIVGHWPWTRLNVF
jgi:hypothetical protein